MKRYRLHLVVAAALLVALAIGSYAVAGGGKKNLKADDLSGYQENPDVSTVATGSFRATIDEDARTISYTISYSGIEGTTLQSHIHFGKRALNGGIAAFLCTNLGNGPAGTPACPQAGTVSGVIHEADVVGPVAQGIEPGAFDELVAALRSGHAYANVHSSKWTGGEIRAQIEDRGHDD